MRFLGRRVVPEMALTTIDQDLRSPPPAGGARAEKAGSVVPARLPLVLVVQMAIRFSQIAPRIVQFVAVPVVEFARGPRARSQQPRNAVCFVLSATNCDDPITVAVGAARDGARGQPEPAAESTKPKVNPVTQLAGNRVVRKQSANSFDERGELGAGKVGGGGGL